MKKIISLILLVSICFELNAQVNFSIGKTIYPLHAPGFATFFNSYNAELASSIKTPFKADFPSANGWSIKGGYLIMRDDDAGFYYNTTSGVNLLRTKNEAFFANGESRKTVLHMNEWITDVSLGVGGNNFHIAVNGTIQLRFNKVFCSYVYHDGTESFGPEKNLNGIFSANRLMGGYGGEVGFGIKYVQVVFKAAKIYKPFNKDGSTYLNYYSDLAGYKADAALLVNSSWPTEYLPADYHQFVADQLTSESNNNLIYINDYGWQFGLSLMFIIPKKD